jgi:hypothetical protein
MRGAPQPGFSLLIAADENAGFAWDRRPPGLASPDVPRPEKAKCLAVPGDYGFRLHDSERRAPICPHARQPNPQESVRCVQLRALLRRPLKDADLMAERHVLQLQSGARFHGR